VAEAYVGHFGCAGRLVKVGSRGQPKKSGRYMHSFPKRGQRLDCPACGFTHLVHIEWRQPVPRDAGRVELWLG
jgi:hypothetical protein